MTTGQRIAAKRKEHNFSQEALGEALGVSRQSIYKWESDASLPEIDKLVALSRLFHVSVGWLLGVEEESTTQPETPPTDGELTETQLKMVESILSRYQQEQPKPQKSAWDKWSVRILFAICGLMLSYLMVVNGKIDHMDNQYNNLSNSIYNVTTSVDRQIGNITNRVEEILKAQNDLTADYETEFLSTDLARNTVTFSARVVPKTYVEGMEVVYLADAGDGPAEFPAISGPGKEFTAEITCELSDHITLSAVFINGDTRQTQLLDTYEGLYQGSLPAVIFQGLESVFLHEELQEDGTFTLRQDYGWIKRVDTETKAGTVEIDSIRVGLFKNFELVCWLEPCEKPGNWQVEAEQFFCFPGMSTKLEKGDILSFAAIFTDQYGRQGVEGSIPAFECFGDEISWTDDSDGTPFFDIQNYTY